MRAVIWGIVAFVFTVGNFIFYLATGPWPTSETAGVAMASSAGFAAVPWVLAAILLFSKRYRYATFFKAAAWISIFLFMGTLANLSTKRGEQRRAGTQLTQQQIIDENFIKTAKQLNAQGPVMVSENVRLDKVVAGPGARLTYFYSFLQHSSQDFDRDEFSANIKSEMKQEFCDDKAVKPLLQDGAVFVFSYSGNDGVEIARAELSKHDCGY